MGSFGSLKKRATSSPAKNAAAGSMKTVVIAPDSAVVDLPKNSRGGIKQPDWSKMTADQLRQYSIGMNERRKRAAHDSDFSDEQGNGLANANDPKGDYICVGCNKQKGGKCATGNINRSDLDKGYKSCNKWDFRRICDPELWAPLIPAVVIGFVEAIRAWGCKNCSWRDPNGSGFIDQSGRDQWCERWGFTMFLKNCCGENDNPTIPLNDDGTRKDGSDPDAD